MEPPVQHHSEDPRQAHETPPFPEQKQQPPGSEAEMRPQPDHGERSYTGLGRLKGKSAIITGADSGIGRAIAIAFAREGADVLISYLNEHDDAKETERWVREAGHKALVVPGDIPLVEAAEIRTIFENAPVVGSVLVPARDRRGTNAVWRKPACLFPLRFGNDSFLPHLAAAIETTYSCVVLSLAGIALDVDSAEDLDELARRPGERPSQLLARKLGFPRSATSSVAREAPHGLLATRS